jgi:hypothetical protein
MVEKKHYLTIFWPLLFVFLLVACSSGDGKAAGIAEEEVTMTIELTSPAFEEGAVDGNVPTLRLWVFSLRWSYQRMPSGPEAITCSERWKV